jgi:PAS domain S-box-containing protein
VREQDITEKKQTEEELRRSRELLLASQRMAGMTWVMWDLETGEVTASDALYELLLYDPSRQLDVEEFFVRIHHPDDAARVREWLGSAIVSGRNQLPPLEYRVLRTDGEVRHVRVAGVIERREEGRPKVFATLQDVTERKVAEEERLKLEEEHLMSRKMEALGQLTGGVAHDFNNLLQVINGGADIAMLDLPEEHPAREAVEQIADAGKQAARLVSQLLFFGRRQVMHPAALDLNEVVEDFFRMSPDIVGEDIDVLWRHRVEVSPIRADRTMVEQVLLNLCRNAQEAMPRGGDLTLETRDVDVGEEYRADHPWARPGRYVLLRVSDTGTGMDEETRERVFEPFFSTKGPGKGSGLGLSTVYGIIKQHGGMIDVESEPGRGTVFDLFWPVAEIEEDEGEEGRPAGDEAEEAFEGAQETILLAEDEEMVREMARMILERAGYTVVAVRDGAEALAAFEERAEEIDLAILDVVMPGVGGREAYEQMRARRPGLRALFATGYNMNTVQADFHLDEGLDLIEKPFSRKDLLRAVQRLLEESG